MRVWRRQPDRWGCRSRAVRPRLRSRLKMLTSYSAILTGCTVHSSQIGRLYLHEAGLKGFVERLTFLAFILRASIYVKTRMYMGAQLTSSSTKQSRGSLMHPFLKGPELPF